MIPVIWSSDVAAVVLKPAALSTQAPAPHESLETLLRAQLSDRNYIALPHRLDRPVSGLMLVAFTKRAARLLGEQFAARRITKTYVALVQGVIGEDVQAWSDYLRKVEDEARVEKVDGDEIAKFPGAKFAELEMRVMERYDNRTLVELRPITGRMHQLRIQAASRGHAIIGDSLYGSNEITAGLVAGAIALQAAKLEFNDPATGRRSAGAAPRPIWHQ